MNELQQLKRVLCEIAELRAELLRRRKSSGETEIEALPRVRAYLYELDTPEATDEMAMLESTRETIKALTGLNVELRKSLVQRSDTLKLQ
jgi:hypothetical protein